MSGGAGRGVGGEHHCQCVLVSDTHTDTHTQTHAHRRAQTHTTSSAGCNITVGVYSCLTAAGRLTCSHGFLIAQMCVCVCVCVCVWPTCSHILYRMSLHIKVEMIQMLYDKVREFVLKFHSYGTYCYEQHCTAHSWVALMRWRRYAYVCLFVCVCVCVCTLQSLRITSAVKSEMGIGAIVNLQSNDASKIWNTPMYMHVLWNGPFQVRCMGHYNGRAWRADVHAMWSR